MYYAIFQTVLIAKRLSVRLIIMQAWRGVLVSGCACMSVRYEFTIEIYKALLETELFTLRDSVCTMLPFKLH